MILTFINAFKLPDLRKRLLFVLGAFAIFIFGLHVSVPGIDKEKLEKLFSGGGLLGLLDVFTGGALRKFSIFAMGITPYINASIIMSLLNVVFPKLEELRKEGESGRKIISRYTRYLAITMSLVQGSGLVFMLRGMDILGQKDIWTFVQVVLTVTAGTAFLMWLGDEISENGIGNGVSLLIFCGIIARMPSDVARTAELYKTGGIHLGNIFLLVLLAVGSIAGVVFIILAERRIAVQYAKRIVGRKMYAGTSTYLPLKVNAAGVIPIIFAVSITLLPAQIAQFVPMVRAWVQVFNQSWMYNLFYAVLVVVFTFFYTAVIFNPTEVADNIKKYGGFVPGIRPGKPTADYLDRIVTRITVIGAIFLAAIAVLPQYAQGVTKVQSFYLGGTSLLIVVGVTLDTVQQLEAQMVMRHYEGFIK